jgi:hypothetical protein
VAICTRWLAGGKNAPAMIDAGERGWQWLGENFSVHNPGTRETWRLYYLCALRRAGAQTKRQKIGTHHWYDEAARSLLPQQSPTGEWRGAGGMENEPVVGTALALLFLTGAQDAAPRDLPAPDRAVPPADAQGAASDSPAEREANADTNLRTIRLRFCETDGERWSDEHPVSGLQALIWRDEAAGRAEARPMSFDTKRIIARGTSGEDGRVTFKLPPGHYYVRWTSEKELPYSQTRPRPFEVQATPDEQEQGFGLTKGCTLVLKAVDEDTGRGIPGVRFWWENELGEYWQQTLHPDHLGHAEEASVTDDSGEFRLFWFRASEDTFGVESETLPAGYRLGHPAQATLNFRGENGRFRSGETIEHTFVLTRKDAVKPAEADPAG